MRTLGLIPARGASKGIPNKNLEHVGGVSLVGLAVQSTKGTLLDDVVVSTDCPQIATEATQLGAVVLKRPPALADDNALSIDVALHALSESAGTYTHLMLLQPTTPFRSPTDIDACLELLRKSDADSAISVQEVGGHHPARMHFIVDGELRDTPMREEYEGQPRQTLPPVYIRNGAIYLTKTQTLARRTFRGERSLPWVMPPERSVNIDTPFDLLVARCLAPQVMAVGADVVPAQGGRKRSCS